MTQPKNPTAATPHGDGGDGGKESVKSVLPIPAGIDPDWRERIDFAKRAHQTARAARRQPIMFTHALRLGDGPSQGRDCTVAPEVYPPDAVPCGVQCRRSNQTVASPAGGSGPRC